MLGTSCPFVRKSVFKVFKAHNSQARLTCFMILIFVVVVVIVIIIIIIIIVVVVVVVLSCVEYVIIL